MVELGDEVKDKVTGFRGIVIGLARHLTGCDRVSVQPPVDKDGKHLDGYWFDINAVELITKGKVNPNDVQEQGPKARKGGPATKAELR